MINENEIIIFETKDKSISLPVRIENESVWLNRNQMAELFERDVKTIGKHINNALREELSEQNSVVAKFATTASDNIKWNGCSVAITFIVGQKKLFYMRWFTIKYLLFI